jgi:hypothetical protein
LSDSAESWIGWDAPCREARLGRVLNNARFLILPWVEVKNLASKVLSLAAARVAEDFLARYGEPAVLLETFVQTPRFAGTCYRAANWQHVGETAGRGKCDRTHRATLPRKAVYVYPLTADFRAALGGEHERTDRGARRHSPRGSTPEPARAPDLGRTRRQTDGKYS